MKKREYEFSTNFKSVKMRTDNIIEEDKYDYLGRNLTNQIRNQNSVKWITVKYVNGRLYKR